MKGKGVQFGIRAFYACCEEEDRIARHLSGRIELIEIYYPDKGSLRDKGDKENEDKNQIIKQYKEKVIFEGQARGLRFLDLMVLYSYI